MNRYGEAFPERGIANTGHCLTPIVSPSLTRFRIWTLDDLSWLAVAYFLVGF